MIHVRINSLRDVVHTQYCTAARTHQYRIVAFVAEGETRPSSNLWLVVPYTPEFGAIPVQPESRAVGVP